MNNTMVREIRGAKINPKSSFKNQGAQNMRGRKLRQQIRYSFRPYHGPSENEYQEHILGV